MPGFAGEKSQEIKIAIDAHENSQTKPLPVVVMLMGLLLVLHVASTKLRAQQATAVERGHSINDLNTSAQVGFGDVSQAVSEDPSSAAPQPAWQYGGFVDLGYLLDLNHPANRLFRSRGIAFHVDRVHLNMAGVYAKKKATEESRWGVELTAHTGKDSELFGFSATAPNIAGFKFLRHLGPTNVSYLAPAGKGLALQAFGAAISDPGTLMRGKTY